MAPPQTPVHSGEYSQFTRFEESPQPPAIGNEEPFADIVRKLSFYFVDVIDSPHTFEQLRTTSIGQKFHPLVLSLAENGHHPAIVAALLTLKWHFSSSLEPDDRGINETRGLACEIVAWRFLTHLSEREIVDCLLYELPEVGSDAEESGDAELGEASGNGHSYRGQSVDENTALLSRVPAPPSPDIRRHRLSRPVSHMGTYHVEGGRPDTLEEDPTSSFACLNALEIAVVADAKRFLSQRTVQKVINGIWNGNIVFWETLSVHTTKKAHFYNKRKADPFCRLRVPKYQKAFEVLFFASFLALYYAVLVERNPRRITPVETFLYIWIAAFAYDELSEFRDAGTLFYSADFWSLWDLGIIGVGIAYLVARSLGLAKGDPDITEVSFDILSLEALFLVPRIFSLLSLNPYFGTLIPCLKEMTKDFIKFLGVVIILYLGFLTTFTLLGRDRFTLNEMSWILIKVFFGSTYLGFDAMREISPILGPGLMLIFVCMTNILLITSLISLLSNSLTKVMDHAREEYLFVYSVFVLESSTSNRLTFFYPPLNLIPLVLIRPLRLILPAESLRSARIVLLKITHFPFVAAIWAYEIGHLYMTGVDNRDGLTSLGPGGTSTSKFLANRRALNRTVSLDDRREMPTTPRQTTSAGRRVACDSQVSVAELKEMVGRLSVQIEELAATIAQQQLK